MCTLLLAPLFIVNYWRFPILRMISSNNIRLITRHEGNCAFENVMLCDLLCDLPLARRRYVFFSMNTDFFVSCCGSFLHERMLPSFDNSPNLNYGAVNMSLMRRLHTCKSPPQNQYKLYRTKERNK